jgi:hypothetical protein
MRRFRYSFSWEDSNCHEYEFVINYMVTADEPDVNYWGGVEDEFLEYEDGTPVPADLEQEVRKDQPFFDQILDAALEHAMEDI